jgi:hypothetical protein
MFKYWSVDFQKYTTLLSGHAFTQTFTPPPLKQLILLYLVLFASTALTSNQKSAALQSCPWGNGERRDGCILQLYVLGKLLYYLYAWLYVWNFERSLCGSRIKVKKVTKGRGRKIYLYFIIPRGNVTWPKSVTCDSPVALLNDPPLTIWPRLCADVADYDFKLN